MKKKTGNGNNCKAAGVVDEAVAAIEPKVKISLGDKEFGRY